MKNFIYTYAMTTIGCVLYGIGINAFFIPHNLLSGGISGFAIILYYTLGFSVGLTNFLLNIPIMVACYKYMGRQYTLISIFGTIASSIFVDATSFLANTTIIHDPIISTIAGGILMGIGNGLMYRHNGNGGGLDVVAAIVKKFYSLEMGNIVFAINCIIIAIAAYLFTLELAILTLIGTFITAAVTNKVVIGFNQRKSVFIVSNHYAEICTATIRYIGRGATILYGQGAYTGQEKKVIFVIINLTQIAKVKEIVNRIDPNAFIFINDAAEVVGNGFTKPVTKDVITGMNMPKVKRQLSSEN